MRRFLSSLFSERSSHTTDLRRTHALRAELASLSDAELRSRARSVTDRLDTVACAAVVAHRVLGLQMFDVQLEGALALTRGRIVEMKTGEGKTLAAVPAIIWYAKSGNGAHVLTVNDYLARRDAGWMGGIYEFFGLSVGNVQSGMTPAERRRAYACDITYATANEIGFDYLRDQIALHPEEEVHRPFAVAVIDEADSILIDEARVPLIIAGGDSESDSLAQRVDRFVRRLRPFVHYTVDEHGRNVALTDSGIYETEACLGCGSLFVDENAGLLAAVQDAIHAHALLHRDVDYLVEDGAIESVDEFKGRIVRDRRWPPGLHTALEAKEGVTLKTQGHVLGSITLQNLVALYPQVCGMTGTAATQAEEFRTIYGLTVEVIPTHRPVIRVDHPDVIFATKREKEDAVLEETGTVHATGQPILVGTTSVQESERFSARLRGYGIPHRVLNAANEELEASIVAGAGGRGAVTISTNMAGRGTDIRLGEGVAELGGLYVIGTNRHESRRIDNQLRGRAGRQGDPGRSRFFISLEDDLLVKFGIDDPLFQGDPSGIQRVMEGQNLDIRQFLHKYESVVEAQRQAIQAERQDVLTGRTPSASEFERLVRLTSIDELWTEYLAAIAELRSGIQWVTWGGRDPLFEYLFTVDRMFRDWPTRLQDEVERRLSTGESDGTTATRRGATWTYLTTDRPFGSMTERFFRGFRKRHGSRH